MVTEVASAYLDTLFSASSAQKYIADLDFTWVASDAVRFRGHFDGQAARMRLEGGGQSLVREQWRVYPLPRFAKLIQCGAGSLLQAPEELELQLRVPADLLLHETELYLQGDQLLLRTVMQVALDLASLVVLRSHQTLA